MKHAEPESTSAPASVLSVDVTSGPVYVRDLLGVVVTWDMTDDQVLALATAAAPELPAHVALSLAVVKTADLVAEMRDHAPID